jgi:hypothetical protein
MQREQLGEPFVVDPPKRSIAEAELVPIARKNHD